MSETSNRRSEEFLKISDQFQLGVLTTESSHPVTANLSETAKRDVSAALGLLFEADGDNVRKYREFAESGRAQGIKETVLRALKSGGKVFFTGCGSTGRLSIQLVSIWRDFWQQQRARGLKCSPTPEEFENRAFSVMAGGDFALIKSVEGFEDFTEFGKKQIGDLGVSAKDVVFAITEGGETSFVIGTAWKGLEVGAKVYFVYNNPDDILCKHVKRSREVIQEPRIEKINLTTGPMSITGSTRMQATTIQLCVMLTVLEMVLRDLMKELEPKGPGALDSASVPSEFLKRLVEMHANLMSPEFRSQLAKAVSLEESVYRSKHKNNYFADRFGIDVLTDTTERSPDLLLAAVPQVRRHDGHGVVVVPVHALPGHPEGLGADHQAPAEVCGMDRAGSARPGERGQSGAHLRDRAQDQHGRADAVQGGPGWPEVPAAGQGRQRGGHRFRDRESVACCRRTGFIAGNSKPRRRRASRSG